MTLRKGIIRIMRNSNIKNNDKIYNYLNTFIKLNFLKSKTKTLDILIWVTGIVNKKEM